MTTPTKDQALAIFVQLATQTRATPAEHEAIKAAYDKLSSLVEPAKVSSSKKS